MGQKMRKFNNHINYGEKISADL